jgi:hypothetical protein
MAPPRALASLLRRVLQANGAAAPASRRAFVSPARDLPPDEHVPEKYTGPSKAEVLAMRKEFLSPGLFCCLPLSRARASEARRGAARTVRMQAAGLARAPETTHGSRF